MSRDALVEVLCARHCVFFKPWKVEEERCGGYQWFARRACGEQGLGGLESLEPLSSRRALDHDALVAEVLCAGCAFREADCDFRDPAGPADAAPCGGALALDALVTLGRLSGASLGRRRTQGTAGT